MNAHARAARERVLWTLSILALLQIGLMVMLPRMAWLTDSTPCYGDSLAKLRRRLEKFRTPPLVVTVFGSSRVYNGVNGTLAGQVLSEAEGRPVLVHNFGRQGGGSVTSLLYLRRLLADGIRPDLVVIEVLPYYLGQPDPLTEVSDIYHPITSLRRDELALIRRYSGGHCTLSTLRWWEAHLLPWYTYRQALLLNTLPLFISLEERCRFVSFIDDSGWRALHGECTEMTQFDSVHRRLREWLRPVVRRVYRDGSEANALRESLALCQAHGIRTALLLMPEGPLIRSLYPPRHWADFMATLEQIGREAGAPVINARLWSKRTDFKESHHLLVEGASIFTHRLTKEVLAPLLVPPSTGERTLLHSANRGQSP